ncbi:MAG: hypothetical protein H0T51_03180 [Pirellulales bacterium]|nr:hypothetical protein [Pirellulales bacterium]
MVANHSAYEPQWAVIACGRPTPAPPANPIPADSREASELLESLDDAMFAAIAGDEAAMATARELWTRALAGLSPDLIDESREQYLRFAVDETRRFESDQTRDLAKTMIAVEVIELLTRA